MRRRRGTALAVLGVAWSMAACAPQPVDLAPGAAERLQAAVAEVVAAADEGRFDAAQAALTRARAVLDDAADRGELSVARYRAIDGALSRTQAEVEAAALAASEQEASAGATVEPGTPEATPADSGAGPAPAPPPDPPREKDKGPGDKHPGDKGGGPGKGRGG